MALITKTVLVKWSNNTKRWYENKGYIFTHKYDIFEVKVEDLMKGSNAEVKVQCDSCGEILRNVKWSTYINYVKDNGKYYCRICAIKLYGYEKTRLIKLQKGISFEQWCLDNNKQSVLNRWDYKLNNKSPNEIGFSSHKKYYFKCQRGLHDPELKSIVNYVRKRGSIECKKCNSFAQWGIDNIGEDFLDKYWDYKRNTINPWNIAKCSLKIVYIKCQEKDYHESYPISCSNFTLYRNRCPCCVNHKIHPLDSLGTLYPEALNVWSNKNKKSPYEYAPKSEQKVYWKCPDDKHKDFKRNINNSNISNFRCPECQYSNGENVISVYLTKNNILYIPQKTFSYLIGLYDGNLSYDFYLPQYNLLIEYQGRQHEKYIKGFHKSIKDFEKQQEHDKRKREYAKKHNIDLLEIWYWDFDNIEGILEEYLGL